MNALADSPSKPHRSCGDQPSNIKGNAEDIDGDIAQFSECNHSECASEEEESCRKLDEAAKKGICLSELRRGDMMRWGLLPTYLRSNQNEGKVSWCASRSTVEGVTVKDEVLTAYSPVTQENRKRKHTSSSQFDEAEEDKCSKKIRRNFCRNKKQIKIKLENSKHRWSSERYKLAEKNLFDILKNEGAVFENKISRPALRDAARKCIGDTGLLDHLLKHIDGEISPGGTDRFRRWHNTNGVMEYWLESPDLVHVRREAGVQDPFWIPPSWWKTGVIPSQESVQAGELELLKEEMVKIKRDMQELTSNKQEKDQANQIEDMHKELMKWRAMSEENLLVISSSLRGMQDMCKELMTWKAKTEQQLVEISNSLSSMQVSKHTTAALSPDSERWEDWLENPNLDNIQDKELSPWLGSTDLVNTHQEAALQDFPLALPPQTKFAHNLSEDPIFRRELELLKEEVANLKRDVHEMVPHKPEEDSSATTNSKLDLENSLLLFQEMFKEMVKWRTKMEQQMIEISNSVTRMQASKNIGYLHSHNF